MRNNNKYKITITELLEIFDRSNIGLWVSNGLHQKTTAPFDLIFKCMEMEKLSMLKVKEKYNRFSKN